MKIQKTFAYTLSILGYLCFAFCWLYKLDILPGLHGDEAWAGLKAASYGEKGIAGWHGMNFYTGILQSIASFLSFRMFGLSVSSLRLPGVLANLAAIFIICRLLKSKYGLKLVWAFLLVFSQSALYLTAPRVAWEVNSFTLLFFALLMTAVIHLMEGSRVHKDWLMLFLLVNLIGSYNHILFSCLSVAALMAVFLWMLYTSAPAGMLMLLVLGVNMINITAAFLLTQHLPGIWILQKPLFYIFTIPLLLFAEATFIRWMETKVSGFKVAFLIPKTFVLLFTGALFVPFCWFHGLALFDVLTNYKLLIHVYSYPVVRSLQVLFIINGATITFYILYFLAIDLRNSTRSLFAFLIIAYMGILPLYTLQNSFRYYLMLSALLYVYLAYKMITSAGIHRKVLGGSLLVMSFLLIGVLFQVFRNPYRPKNAIDLTIGKQQMETSAHFLPDKPLIDFLRQNHIGRITYVSDAYFLEQPILFYKLITPWEEDPHRHAIIDYDYLGSKQGFMLYKE